MRYASITAVSNTGWRHFPLNISIGRHRISDYGRLISGDARLVVSLLQRIAQKGNRKDFLRIVSHDKTLLLLFSGGIVVGMILIGLVAITSMLLLL